MKTKLIKAEIDMIRAKKRKTPEEWLMVAKYLAYMNANGRLNEVVSQKGKTK